MYLFADQVLLQGGLDACSNNRWWKACLECLRCRASSDQVLELLWVTPNIHSVVYSKWFYLLLLQSSAWKIFDGGEWSFPWETQRLSSTGLQFINHYFNYAWDILFLTTSYLLHLFFSFLFGGWKQNFSFWILEYYQESTSYEKANSQVPKQPINTNNENIRPFSTLYFLERVIVK